MDCAGLDVISIEPQFRVATSIEKWEVSIRVPEGKVIIPFVLCSLVVMVPIHIRPVLGLFISLLIDPHEVIPLEDKEHNREQKRTKQDPKAGNEPGCVLISK